MTHAEYVVQGHKQAEYRGRFSGEGTSAIERANQWKGLLELNGDQYDAERGGSMNPLVEISLDGQVVHRFRTSPERASRFVGVPISDF